jgi:hypothetical protein
MGSYLRSARHLRHPIPIRCPRRRTAEQSFKHTRCRRTGRTSTVIRGRRLNLLGRQEALQHAFSQRIKVLRAGAVDPDPSSRTNLREHPFPNCPKRFAGARGAALGTDLGANRPAYVCGRVGSEASACGPRNNSPWSSRPWPSARASASTDGSAPVAQRARSGAPRRPAGQRVVRPKVGHPRRERAATRWRVGPSCSTRRCRG